MAVDSSSSHQAGSYVSHGVLHLSNGAVITLIVMVLLTFISLVGLLVLYFWCPRRRGLVNPQLMGIPHRNQQQRPPKIGLTVDALKKMPILSWSLLVEMLGRENVGCCAVCLGDFPETEERIRLLPRCRHCFHPACVDKWLCSSASCPLCRSSLLEKAPISLDSPQQVTEHHSINITQQGSTFVQQTDDTIAV